jgi:hypothetical protein
MLATPDAMTLAVAWKGTNRPGPFPGAFVSKLKASTFTTSTYLLLLLHGEGEGAQKNKRTPRLSPRSRLTDTLQLSPKHVPVPARGLFVAKPQARSLLPFVLLTFASSSSHLASNHRPSTNAHPLTTSWLSFLLFLYHIVLSTETRCRDEDHFLVLAALPRA